MGIAGAWRASDLTEKETVAGEIPLYSCQLRRGLHSRPLRPMFGQLPQIMILKTRGR